MPKKNFIIENLNEKQAENLKHMEIVAKSEKLLEKVVGMVKDKKYSKSLSSGCKISTRAVKSLKCKYPVVSCRVKFSDSETKGQGKKLTLPVHHVMMFHKLRKTDSNAPLWSYSNDDDVISHDCHNPSCYKHLSITTTEDNNSKNIHCFGYVKCTVCKVRIEVCEHEPKCVPFKLSICTNCK